MKAHFDSRAARAISRPIYATVNELPRGRKRLSGRLGLFSRTERGLGELHEEVTLEGGADAGDEADHSAAAVDQLSELGEPGRRILGDQFARTRCKTCPSSMCVHLDGARGGRKHTHPLLR